MSGASHQVKDQTRFSIVACVKSRADERSLAATALAHTFLPSLVRTVSPAERASWHIGLYLCADDSDQFYVSQAAAVRNLSAALAPWLHLRLLFYPATRNRVPNREAALQAYADGAEYIHRTNDDIAFMTSGWLTVSVSALRRLRPANVGVVGPKVYGDGIRGGATTLDVVHRTHLDIFADYYPPQLDNWFVDDWIAFAYTRGRRRRTYVLHRHDKFPDLDWTVQHQFTKRRYVVAMAQKYFLPALIECGRDAVDEWLNHTERAAAACAAGATDTPPWPRVSCRAVEAMPPPSSPLLHVPADAAVSSGRRLARVKSGAKGGGGAKGGVKSGAKGGGGAKGGWREERCRERHETVMPFEKNGYYPQVAGYCAARYPFPRGPCRPNGD